MEMVTAVMKSVVSWEDKQMMYSHCDKVLASLCLTALEWEDGRKKLYVTSVQMT